MEFSDPSPVRAVIDALPRSRIRKLALTPELGPEGTERLAVPELLASASSWGSLTALALDAGRLDSTGLEVLFACHHLRQLRRLELDGDDWSSGRDVERLAECPHLAGLTSLSLGACGSDSVLPLEALARSPYLTRLVSLNLGGAAVNEAGLAALAGSPNMQHLRVLRLRCDVEDGVLEAIDRSPHLRRLTTLSFPPVGLLRPKQRSDRVALALAGAENLPNLAFLNCCWAGLTEAGLRALWANRRLAWPGSFRRDDHDPALRQAFTERYGSLTAYDLVGDELDPFFPWVGVW